MTWSNIISKISCNAHKMTLNLQYLIKGFDKKGIFDDFSIKK